MEFNLAFKGLRAKIVNRQRKGVLVTKCEGYIITYLNITWIFFE